MKLAGGWGSLKVATMAVPLGVKLAAMLELPTVVWSVVLLVDGWVVTMVVLMVGWMVELRAGRWVAR